LSSSSAGRFGDSLGTGAHPERDPRRLRSSGRARQRAWRQLASAGRQRVGGRIQLASLRWSRVLFRAASFGGHRLGGGRRAEAREAGGRFGGRSHLGVAAVCAGHFGGLLRRERPTVGSHFGGELTSVAYGARRFGVELRRARAIEGTSVFPVGSGGSARSRGVSAPRGRAGRAVKPVPFRRCWRDRERGRAGLASAVSAREMEPGSFNGKRGTASETAYGCAGGGKLWRVQPQERMRHETRPPGTGRIKAPRGRENLRAQVDG
jgi:hypothetical protein